MTVGVVGLRFGEANTESTASFPRTSLRTSWRDVNPRRTVKVDADGRCILAVNGEVLAPCTASHKRAFFPRHTNFGCCEGRENVATNSESQPPHDSLNFGLW